MFLSVAVVVVIGIIWLAYLGRSSQTEVTITNPVVKAGGRLIIHHSSKHYQNIPQFLSNKVAITNQVGKNMMNPISVDIQRIVSIKNSDQKSAAIKELVSREVTISGFMSGEEYDLLKNSGISSISNICSNGIGGTGNGWSKYYNDESDADIYVFPGTPSGEYTLVTTADSYCATKVPPTQLTFRVE